MSGAIYSLGSVNLDHQVRAERWPEPGESLLARDFLRLGGGKGANVAWLARRLGAPAVLLARVGDDGMGDRALRPLEEAGVDLSSVEREPGGTTGAALIVVREDGRKTILLAANANDDWPPAAVERARRRVAAAPAGSLLVADLEVDPAATRAALEAARGRGLTIVLDPSPADRVDDDLLAGCHLTPNASEAAMLLGARRGEPPGEGPEAARRAAETLRRRGAAAAYLKLAGGGCVVAGEEGTEHVPAPEVERVDSTGAGDAFAAALAVALWEGRPPRQAARFAVAAAAHAVTGYGSRPAYPAREEVEELLRRMSAEG